MAEVIGKATLEIVADAAPLESGLAKAENSIKAMEKTAATSGQKTSSSFKTVGDAANDASRRIETSGRRLLSQLERESTQLGKTRSEWLAYRAQQLGVSDAAAPMIARIRESEQALQKTGVSAAQTAAALRMVPAQMTDIVTQLAGGSSPLLVLTQQGGQLKDSFGGIGPTLRGVGGYLAALVSPLTVTAAAAAILATAMYQGGQEANAFNRSLILTGNYAGKTADQLSSMAAKIRDDGFGTQGLAAEVLNKLTATGKIAGDQIEAIGTAAIAMNKATGTAVDDTIKKFVELGEEPSKAIVKLNEQYHFLTEATYRQILALEEQGKTEDAAALAQKTFADALRTRSTEVQRHLGFMERAWQGVTGAAKSAWDAMLGVGRDTTLADIRGAIERTQKEIERLENAPSAQAGGSNWNRAALLRMRQQLEQLRAQAKPLEDAQQKTAADSARQRQEDDKIAARSRLEAQAKATRSRAEQRKDEIEQLKRDAALVGMAADEYNRRVAAIEEKYKDPKTAKPKAIQDDAATKMLQSLRDQEAATRAALASSDKLTGAEKQRAEFLQQIADLKDKKILTADQRSLLANEAAIRAQLDQNVASEQSLKLKEEIAKVEERSKQINEQIRNQQSSRREGYARELDAFGLGANARKQVEAFKAITREYEQMQWQLEKATKPEARTSNQYLQAQADIKAGLQQSLQDYSDYYAALQTRQGDWRNGALAAFSDYRDYAANMADQTGRAFGSAFQGMEDAIVKFVSTGKLSVASFAESVIADLIRIQTRMALSGLAQMGINFIGGLFAPAAAGAASAGSAWNGFSTGPAANVSYAGLAGARENGGPVSAGRAYLVGERRPEIFVPDRSGVILPDAGALSGSNVTVNVSLIEDASKAGKVEQQRNGSQLDIKAYVAQIVKQTVAGDIASGGGQISTALERGYGLNRMRGR